MTVKGQKNHYNVKVLCGHGATICLKNNRLCLKGGKEVFSSQQEVDKWFVTQLTCEGVVTGCVQWLCTTCRSCDLYQYAADIINALLNYRYSTLAAEIAKFVIGVGLDPYCGFMHKTHNSFQALVYDLIDRFRWLV
jgi:hypothetical protein